MSFQGSDNRTEFMLGEQSVLHDLWADRLCEGEQMFAMVSARRISAAMHFHLNVKL
jgi:hypothetical protein